MKRYNVTYAGEGYQLFTGEGLRMGFWGDKPRAGEITVGTVSVRPRDPDIPFFAKHNPHDCPEDCGSYDNRTNSFLCDGCKALVRECCGGGYIETGDGCPECGVVHK